MAQASFYRAAADKSPSAGGTQYLQCSSGLVLIGALCGRQWLQDSQLSMRSPKGSLNTPPCIPAFTGDILCMQESACERLKALGRDVGGDLMAADMAVMLVQKRQACQRAQTVL